MVCNGGQTSERLPNDPLIGKRQINAGNQRGLAAAVCDSFALCGKSRCPREVHEHAPHSPATLTERWIAASGHHGANFTRS